MKISLVINCDTREQNDTFKGNNLGGVVNMDFLTHGLINKIKFFLGFDLEVILYIDEHTKIDKNLFEWLNQIVHVLVIRKHTQEEHFNDWNYIRALQMASGDIVVHIDQDTALFTSGKEYVCELINMLEDYTYISYPSHWTPNAVHDPSFNYRWVSTRFFMCKRSSLDLAEVIKCLNDYDYFCDTYKPSRICNWTEHFLGLIAKSNVFYPPIEPYKGLIFSWGSYQKGTLEMLNNMPYEEVKEWVRLRGGIGYPNDVHC